MAGMAEFAPTAIEFNHQGGAAPFAVTGSATAVFRRLLYFKLPIAAACIICRRIRHTECLRWSGWLA